MKKFKIFRFQNNKLQEETLQEWESIEDLMDYWKGWDKKQFRIQNREIESDYIHSDMTNRMESGHAITFQHFLSGNNFEERISANMVFNYTVVQIS